MVKRTTQSHEVETEVDGKIYRGTYRVESGVVIVDLPFIGIKAAQIGGSTAAGIARILLTELVLQERDQSLEG